MYEWTWYLQYSTASYSELQDYQNQLARTRPIIRQIGRVIATFLSTL